MISTRYDHRREDYMFAREQGRYGTRLECTGPALKCWCGIAASVLLGVALLLIVLAV